MGDKTHSTDFSSGKSDSKYPPYCIVNLLTYGEVVGHDVVATRQCLLADRINPSYSDILFDTPGAALASS